jgi:hypothetical protein
MKSRRIERKTLYFLGNKCGHHLKKEPHKFVLHHLAAIKYNARCRHEIQKQIIVRVVARHYETLKNCSEVRCSRNTYHCTKKALGTCLEWRTIGYFVPYLRFC